MGFRTLKNAELKALVDGMVGTSRLHVGQPNHDCGEALGQERLSNRED